MNRNTMKRKNMKQKLAFLLVLSMLATPLAELKVQAEEAEQNLTEEAETYSYETDFTITSSWEGHYNATITIENTGDTTIHNWHLGFETKDTIESLWNGTVYKEEDGYHVIKNAGWNGDIAPGESVTFGFLAGCEEEPDTPENYTLPVGEIRVDEGDYTAEFTMENTWDSSFSGAGITIKNLTGEPMEDWSCSFDFAGAIPGDDPEDFPVEITLLWDGEIVSREGNRYTIKHAVNNPDIPAGGEVTFGFNGEWETAVSGNDITLPQPTNITLSCMGYDPEAGENSGGQGGNGEQGEAGGNTEAGGTVSGGDVSGNDPLEEMDSDGDGISDAAELRLGFDPYSVDTDGDGMPDGYELYTLYPVLLDKGYPEEAGMLPEDDYDEDGLNNLEEYLANTHPGNADTDGDGLDDYEEIHTYETKPDSTDTDGDGLNDGLEISQGMNPDHTDSDGDGTPDGEETITQLFTVEETTKKPLSEAGVLPTLAITGKGDYSTRLTILDMSYNTMFERTGFVVGSAYDFYHLQDITFEGAELTFQISEEVLKENNLVDLAVAWYDEENKTFQVLDTTYDIKTSTITAKPEHFSTYTVLNKKRLYTNLIRGQKEAEEGNASMEAGQAGTGYYDPEAEDFNGHRYLLVNKGMSWTNAQAYCNELGGHLVIINNAEEQAFLTDLMARKGTQNTYYIGLSGENNQCSWVDGTPLSYQNWAPGEPNNSSENVIHMYVRDYGIAHAGEWNDTYNNTAFGGGFYWNAVYTGFICEFDGQRGPRYIVLSNGECVLLDADPALGDMSVDTDGDGIPDLVELGKEITMEIPKYYGAYYENDETVTVTAWEFRSNPAVADTDGDGFPDNNDLNPTEYDVAVEKVVGVTGGAGTVIRLNTGAIWRLSGLKNLNEYYEQYYTRIFNISPGGKEYLESIKELLDANKESNFTIKELAIFQRIDLSGVVDYMDGRNFAFKKQLLSEVRGEQCTDEAARNAYSIVSAASAWTDYFRVTWNQIVRGKFAEETNLLG
ncbi:MAG: cellulose binding domain-containing protein, partial [Lachnospiraceae bacterium]|nr:cellulose binding domain-containing protein [Lachnospiraceae bacterium]